MYMSFFLFGILLTFTSYNNMIKLGDTMLVNMTKMLNDAREGKYAVAHFNINNLEWTKFILEKVEELHVPVILGVSEGAAKYMGGYKTVVDMVIDLHDYLNVTVPVAIHLDHGSSFDVCKEAIDAGFTSVMIDASKYELDENIKIVTKVVEYAKIRNVSVEAEVGHVGGQEDTVNSGILYAEVDDCVRFVNETGINFLAPALGSVHGPYKGEPNLQYDRMQEISDKTHVPLVLHGGSGLTPELFRHAISCGTCKINVNTELQQVWTKDVRLLLNNDADVYDPRKVIKGGEKAIKDKVEEFVKIFGTKKID